MKSTFINMQEWQLLLERPRSAAGAWRLFWLLEAGGAWEGCLPSPALWVCVKSPSPHICNTVLITPHCALESPGKLKKVPQSFKCVSRMTAPSALRIPLVFQLLFLLSNKLYWDILHAMCTCFYTLIIKQMFLAHTSLGGWVQLALDSGFRTGFETERPFPQNNWKPDT